MTEFNCPNCGAPITGDMCQYCGTAFIDWSSIDLHKTNWIKIKLDGQIILVKAAVCHLGFNYGDPEPTYLYADNKPICVLPANPSMQIEATLDCIPFKVPGNKQYRDALFVEIDQNKADLQSAGEFVHQIIERG